MNLEQTVKQLKRIVTKNDDDLEALQIAIQMLSNMLPKKEPKHILCSIDEQELVIYLFRKGGNNSSQTIANKTGLKLSMVNKIIDIYLKNNYNFGK